MWENQGPLFALLLEPSLPEPVMSLHLAESDWVKQNTAFLASALGGHRAARCQLEFQTWVTALQSWQPPRAILWDPGDLAWWLQESGLDSHVAQCHSSSA